MNLLSLEVSVQTRSISVNEIRRFALRALDALGFASGQLSVSIVTAMAIREVHREFMNDDTVTDVIAFDYIETAEDDAIDGELIVCSEVARAESSRRGIPFRRELLRYVVHGLLHLRGYDDHTPAGRKRMRDKERRVLKKLGMWDATEKKE
ncbi:MAG: rRNA maturation RNase YbeY [Planctomycetes bacterium]|nr:rRNA maturation RNase YbeY [Planctomycetota bacterium]